MDAIAVGGLEQQRLGLGGVAGIGQDRPPVAAQVAPEQDALPVALAGEANERRAEQMTSVGVLGVKAVTQVDWQVEVDDLEPPERGFGIGNGEERFRRLMAGEPALVGEPRVLFLQIRGIREHQRTERRSAGRAVDGPSESSRHQARQQPRMVDVRMREQHGRNRGRVHRKRRPVAAAEFAQALELSTIDEEPPVIDFEEVLRTGHCASSAKKGERGHPSALY